MDLYDDHAIVGMTVQILLNNLRIPTNIRICSAFFENNQFSWFCSILLD